MTQKEIKESIEGMEKLRKELMKSKEASIQFLKDAGILTKKGNLKKQYEDLCTLPTRRDRT